MLTLHQLKVFAAVVAWFIVVACAATLHSIGKYNIETGADAAQAFHPLAGDWAYLLFAAGLFNASLFAASILPISTAYTVCEGLGFESGLDPGPVEQRCLVEVGKVGGVHET